MSTTAACVTPRLVFREFQELMSLYKLRNVSSCLRYAINCMQSNENPSAVVRAPKANSLKKVLCGQYTGMHNHACTMSFPLQT